MFVVMGDTFVHLMTLHFVFIISFMYTQCIVCTSDIKECSYLPPQKTSVDLLKVLKSRIQYQMFFL